MNSVTRRTAIKGAFLTTGLAALGHVHIAQASADAVETSFLTTVSPGYPAVVDTGRGLAAFALGPKRYLRYRYQSGGAWSKFDLIQETALDCRPIAVTVPNGAIVVFARSGGELVHCWQNTYGGEWSDWHGLGVVTGTNEPTVTVGPTGRMAVHVRNAQGSVLYREQQSESGAWGAWLDLGVAGRPCAVIGGSGGGVVFARSGTGLVHRWQVGVGDDWSAGWTGLGGSLGGDPAVAVTPIGALAVVARSDDGRLAYLGQQTGGGAWGTFASIGDRTITGRPAVLTGPNGGLVVVARDAGRRVWLAEQDGHGGAWAWTDLGGATATDPSAVRSATGEISVFGVTAEGAMTWTRRTGAGWQPWQTWANDGVVTV
ncbi:hypothetical protein SK571_04230 [Lentzea sp. BCCO 10_0798]|uniref:PLL-like beta propeller domain-containing protein n=1 Tax=Lentzea kristufekii TaxID=3095430 RepID=A0ABU4TJY3_9PSEU|nr:hypothetical protein [Lentzea sp. BCCO 10_0798]MDX8048576.1 hypothetical protein [Lentzea sp. BCCO 10_0798]